jgi:hypothetical protein
LRQVADEAHQGGLLSVGELRSTVGELRNTYASALAALGLDADALPDPSLDEQPPSARKAASLVRGRVAFRPSRSGSAARGSPGRLLSVCVLCDCA